MKQDISRCGYKCEICPAYKDNVTGTDYQRFVSDTWFKIYGFRIPHQQCICDGCFADDVDSPRRIDTDCPVRLCVIEKGIPNCAHCDGYICAKLEQKLVDPQKVLAKCKEPVSQDQT